MNVRMIEEMTSMKKRLLVSSCILLVLLGTQSFSAIAASTPTADASPTSSSVHRAVASDASVYLSVAAASIALLEARAVNSEALFATAHFDDPNWIANISADSSSWLTFPSYFLSPPAGNTNLMQQDQSIQIAISLLTDATPTVNKAITTRSADAISIVSTILPLYKAALDGVQSSVAKLSGAPSAQGPGGARPTTAATHTISGTLELTDYNGDFSSSCSGSGGYSDLAPGASVVVKDEAGIIIATGSVTTGKAYNLNNCDFTFVVYNVPDAKFYDITIGHRTGPAYSEADMESMNWTLQLTIGS